MADLAGKDWNSIVMYEIQYHKTCYREYTRNLRSSAVVEDDVFEVLCRFVNERLEKKEIVTKSEALNLYKDKGGKDLKDARPLIDKIIEYFEGQVAIWKPNYGKQYLYRTSWSVGDVIDHFTRKLTTLHCEIENLKQNTKEETVEAVARLIRKEIRSAPK
eukprot:TCONS_00039914-protein